MPGKRKAQRIPGFYERWCFFLATHFTGGDCQTQADILLGIIPNPDPNSWVDGTDVCGWTGVTCVGGQVTELRLSGTYTTSLPESIGGLTSLTTLDVSWSRMTSLPEGIGGLKSLTTLDLSYNRCCLTSLPEGIGGLTSLTTLDLNENSLTSLPEGIGELTSLTSLDLADNCVTSLPSSICKVPPSALVRTYHYPLVRTPIPSVPGVICGICLCVVTLVLRTRTTTIQFKFTGTCFTGVFLGFCFIVGLLKAILLSLVVILFGALLFGVRWSLTRCFATATGPKTTSVSRRLQRGLLLPAVDALLVAGACGLINYLVDLLGLLCNTTGSLVGLWLLILDGVTATRFSSQAFFTYPTVDQDALSNHVPRPVWFLRSYKWFAVLGSALTPFFWIAYTANEINFFVHTLKIPDENRRKPASVDGVRAVVPILFILNVAGIGIIGIVWIILLPRVVDQSVSPSTIDTTLSTSSVDDCLHQVRLTQWSAFASGVLVGCVAATCTAFTIATCSLIWSLSEPRARVGNDVVEEDPRANILRQSLRESFALTESEGSDRSRCVSSLIEKATSWNGQTIFSIVNHAATMATLMYGFFAYGEDVFGDQRISELQILLIGAVVVSGVGLIASCVSLCARRFSHLKVTPADDSFRVTCLIKAVLVILKALIVFNLSNVDASPMWEVIVTTLFFTSFLVVAIMTLAFSLRKVWSHQHLLVVVGVKSPQRFLIQYSLSFAAAKLGILLLMVAGTAPDWFGCDTECRSHFFSSQTIGSLMVALMWIPCVVYSNNEVAQLLDGIWWNHVGQRRVGLSTATHGVLVVSPLVQAFVWVCAVVPLLVETDDDYSFDHGRLVANYTAESTSLIPAETNPYWVFYKWPSGLKWFMCGFVVCVNTTMLASTLLDCCCWSCCNKRNAELRESVLATAEEQSFAGSE